MEDVCVVVAMEDHVDLKPSTNDRVRGSRSLARDCCCSVVVSLGLTSFLLMAGLFVLSVHLRRVTAELSTMKTNLIDVNWANSNKLSSLNEERDRLKANLTASTEERNRLQQMFSQKKSCPAGWVKFSCSCYFLSNESGSWMHGRDDCGTRDADLVVIDSAEEQTFVSGLTKRATWIGLTDRDNEGTWTWVDGTPLIVKFWGKKQPDNSGEEDCGHVKAQTAAWNDLPCESTLEWICEKLA